MSCDYARVCQSGCGIVKGKKKEWIAAGGTHLRTHTYLFTQHTQHTNKHTGGRHCRPSQSGRPAALLEFCGGSASFPGRTRSALYA